MSYVYIRSEPGLWTVGFYDPQGKWHGDSDHNSTEDAAKRVHFLNGGSDGAAPKLVAHLQQIERLAREADRSRVDLPDVLGDIARKALA